MELCPISPLAAIESADEDSISAQELDGPVEDSTTEQSKEKKRIARLATRAKAARVRKHAGKEKLEDLKSKIKDLKSKVNKLIRKETSYTEKMSALEHSLKEANAKCGTQLSE